MSVIMSEKIMGDFITNWVDYFFEISKTISLKSKDTTKIGCVIEKDKSIISTGYNGFPSGVFDKVYIEDENKRYKLNPRYERPAKYQYTSHAEENAIAFSARNGVSTNGATIYIYGMAPCSRCARLIIQSGIKKVICIMTVTEESQERWKEEMEVTKEMFNEAGVFLEIFMKKS